MFSAIKLHYLVHNLAESKCLVNTLNNTKVACVRIQSNIWGTQFIQGHNFLFFNNKLCSLKILLAIFP
jgi:hypothetical protein